MPRIIYKGEALTAHDEDKNTTRAIRALLRETFPTIRVSCTTNRHGGTHVVIACGGEFCGSLAASSIRATLRANGHTDAGVAWSSTCDEHAA